MSRFTHLKGTMSKTQFTAIVNKTRYKKSTRKMLAHYLVLGIPYAQNKGASRQFVYKKLRELEKRGLI